MTIFHKSIGKEYKILENGLKKFTTTFISHNPPRNKRKEGNNGKKGTKIKIRKKKIVVCVVEKKKNSKTQFKAKIEIPFLC